MKKLTEPALVFEFADTPAGKLAWYKWNRLSPTEKQATGLLNPLQPGARFFLSPGMKLKVQEPNPDQEIAVSVTSLVSKRKFSL